MVLIQDPILPFMVWIGVINSHERYGGSPFGVTAHQNLSLLLKKDQVMEYFLILIFVLMVVSIIF